MFVNALTLRCFPVIFILFFCFCFVLLFISASSFFVYFVVVFIRIKFFCLHCCCLYQGQFICLLCLLLLISGSSIFVYFVVILVVYLFNNFLFIHLSILSFIYLLIYLSVFLFVIFRTDVRADGRCRRLLAARCGTT